MVVILKKKKPHSSLYLDQTAPRAIFSLTSRNAYNLRNNLYHVFTFIHEETTVCFGF